MVYQSDYCYSPDFARCSVFLAWAARNAAEPAYVSDAAQKAWGSGIAAPEGESAAAVEPAADAADQETLPEPTPEGGLFGLSESATSDESPAEQLDWVSASAWAEAPWDERAEMEAEELAVLETVEPEADDADAVAEEPSAEEATQAPKVPAALPMRKRKPPQEPIRSRGSGEWFYADPPGREPLVSRRYGITPPILLAVLGLLLVSIVVFLLASQLGGDGEPAVTAASPRPAASAAAPATRAPLATAAPSVDPSPTPDTKPRYYRVKSGDSLTGIAQKFNVKPTHLQCINGITNRNVVVLGARYLIPPEGFSCPPGWRKATPGP